MDEAGPRWRPPTSAVADTVGRADSTGASHPLNGPNKAVMASRPSVISSADVLSPGNQGAKLALGGLDDVAQCEP